MRRVTRRLRHADHYNDSQDELVFTRDGSHLLIDGIGWLSSVVLLLTIGTQVIKQWRDRTSKGVSMWLFVGQIAASIGFVIYSALLGNIVFVVTNAAVLVAAIAGLFITIASRRRSHATGGQT